MNAENVTLSIVLPKPMNKELERAAKQTGFKKADVMRQSIRLGLKKFVDQFPKPEAPALATGK